jgi:hypothetical protein
LHKIFQETWILPFSYQHRLFGNVGSFGFLKCFNYHCLVSPFAHRINFFLMYQNHGMASHRRIEPLFQQGGMNPICEPFVLPQAAKEIRPYGS